jgi:predicted oxidoreductase
MLTGVPAYVDGRMLAITEAAGGAVVNRDRMWHYVEGVRNWDPVWPGHAIRILAGPSAMWFDGRGNRLPAPYFPGFDTLGTLDHLQHTGVEHSWFILNRALAGKEFALSGSEQNLDLTERRYRDVLKRPITAVQPSVQAFLGVWWRWGAWLPRAGGDVLGRVPVFRPSCRTIRCCGSRVMSGALG